MAVEVSDEDWALIRDSVLATVGMRSVDQLGPTVKAQRAAAQVVKLIEAARRDRDD